MTEGRSAGDTVEFGILIYPGAQQSAVLGLTDLFVIAERLMGARRPRVRVSHWRADAGVPVRVDGADTGVPTVPILLPSMEEPISPDAAAPLAAWPARMSRPGDGSGLGLRGGVPAGRNRAAQGPAR
ncbi:hypothetical protein PE067_04315 [Paracoccus sp. DMF-8]|uniref:hypothetical protein n=1 Tax=Paracoccus sp. DMF-8 TaxID=3019445 RepID=UPI0023E899BE|nr:hypothetical protein [Paracoccus sp. DMF-8]MDF3605442.1 hypothetical protein [Paracoccus sp. DMF-8]